jgi:hypothetical protein
LVRPEFGSWIDDLGSRFVLAATADLWLL